MSIERVNDKKASIVLLLPIILFMIGLLSPSDVLDRLWFGNEFREIIEEWAPWVVYRANQTEFSQVALLMGGGLWFSAIATIHYCPLSNGSAQVAWWGDAIHGVADIGCMYIVHAGVNGLVLFLSTGYFRD